MEHDFNKLPDKIKKSERSFMQKLKRDINGGSLMSTFQPFPSKVRFDGQENDEHVVLMLRQHWIVLLRTIAITALIVLLMFLTPGYVSFVTNDSGMSVRLTIAVLIIFAIVAVVIAINGFVKWFFTIDVITSERVVDIDFYNILHHNYAEAHLDNIVDVSHNPKGALASVFDYGTVMVQTAAARPDIEFDNIPRPRDVQDVLLDLMEIAKEE
jgi:ABC-type sugar transport system permease subunit